MDFSYEMWRKSRTDFFSIDFFEMQHTMYGECSMSCTPRANRGAFSFVCCWKCWNLFVRMASERHFTYSKKTNKYVQLIKKIVENCHSGCHTHARTNTYITRTHTTVYAEWCVTTHLVPCLNNSKSLHCGIFRQENCSNIFVSASSIYKTLAYINKCH